MSEKQPDVFGEMYQKRIKMTVSIVFITLATIGVFGGIGYLLDLYFETHPVLLFVFIILSFPFTQLLLYKRAKGLMKK